MIPSKPVLTISYSALDARVGNLSAENFRSYPGIEYLLIVQNADGKFTETEAFLKSNFELLQRHDFSIFRNPHEGVTKSRNIGIEKALGKFILFCDDDTSIHYDNIPVLLEFLETNDDLSLICVNSLDKNFKPRKKFPKKQKKISKWNSAKYGTIEIVANLEFLRLNRVRFNLEFGAGTKYYFGDEYLFIADILKDGGRGMHLPLGIVVHEGASTGIRKLPLLDLFGIRLRVFIRVFGVLGIPIVFLLFFRI